MKQVEEAIFGKKVYCFVKFYMADNVLTSQAIEIHTADPQSVKHVVQQPTKERAQFFSPTTKVVLKDISGSTELQVGTSVHPPVSKTTLMFGSIPATISPTTPEKGVGSVNAAPMIREVESPIKKTKKLKNKENKEKAT